MGRRGPAPKPTALKLAGGNPGHRPLNKSEPIPPPGEPEAPESLDPRARLVWDQVVPRIAKVGLARTIDGLALERYCEMVVQWRDLTDFINKNGPTWAVRDKSTVKDGKEAPGRVLDIKEFKQVRICHRLAQLLIQIEREFGLTPAARTRIQIDAEKKSKGDVNDLKRQFFAAGGSSTPPPAHAAG